MFVGHERQPQVECFAFNGIWRHSLCNNGKSPDIKTRVFQPKTSSRNKPTKRTVNFRLPFVAHERQCLSSLFTQIKILIPFRKFNFNVTQFVSQVSCVTGYHDNPACNSINLPGRESTAGEWHTYRIFDWFTIWIFNLKNFNYALSNVLHS